MTSSSQPLTAKQQSFLHYLSEEISSRGYAPSLRQAAADLGISHGAVAQLIKALEEKGYVSREGRYSRDLRILKERRTVSGGKVEDSRLREVAVIGRITAGLPIYAQQEWDGTVLVDGAIFRGANLFALRVKGDSMRDAGIFSGDLVICEPRQFARDGEIVVALIGGEEATVKRFFLHQDHAELRPENSAFPVKQYGFGEILIQGKVVGVIRDEIATSPG